MKIPTARELYDLAWSKSDKNFWGARGRLGPFDFEIENAHYKPGSGRYNKRLTFLTLDITILSYGQKYGNGYRSIVWHPRKPSNETLLLLMIAQ